MTQLLLRLSRCASSKKSDPDLQRSVENFSFDGSTPAQTTPTGERANASRILSHRNKIQRRSANGLRFFPEFFRLIGRPPGLTRRERLHCQTRNGRMVVARTSSAALPAPPRGLRIGSGPRARVGLKRKKRKASTAQRKGPAQAADSAKTGLGRKTTQRRIEP